MSIQGSDDFLFEKTKAAVLVFDQLFAQIAPCRKYNQDIRQQSLEIPVTSLSDIQCNAISTMSGYLERIYNELERRHLESYQKTTLLANLSTLSTDPYPTTVLTQQQLLKKVHLLQDFLINELVRTEELEASVGKLEEKLLIANENCAKMEKKLKKTEFISIETRKATLQISSSPSSVAVPRLDTTKQPVDDHGKYVGQFIRKPFAGKKFFGLICNYSNPYFQIVYEDADFEEADYNEIIKYLWRHDVPTAKRAACYKHAKAEAKLGPLLLKESDILKGEDEIRDSPEPGRDKPAVLGNSLAATSTQPFHEGILSKPSIKSKSASSDVTRHKFSHSTGTLEKRYMLSASKFPVTPSSQQPIGGAPNPSTSATSVTPDHEIVNSMALETAPRSVSSSTSLSRGTESSTIPTSESNTPRTSTKPSHPTLNHRMDTNQLSSLAMMGGHQVQVEVRIGGFNSATGGTCTSTTAVAVPIPSSSTTVVTSSSTSRTSTSSSSAKFVDLTLDDDELENVNRCKRPRPSSEDWS